jgi:NADH dehydrogenase
VYVGDVAQAVVAALERADCQGRTYELGGPQTYTFAELMRYMLEVVGRRRLLLNVPFGLANLQARVLELLPAPLLTRDQVELLKRDNVAAPDMPGLEALGITPTPIELIVPQYLAPYSAPAAPAGRYPA